MKPRHTHAGGHASLTAVNVDRLTRLMPQIRRRLAVRRDFSDAALLASLIAIARHPSHQERWHAAEASTLGRHLAATGGDLHRALVTLLSLLPQP
ncbi:hypothetical protein [Hyphomicrobium sp.]|uniref:hypothetical protein n=1 Tax=Hyphomicrobium sp. TaxID=82 RepID=UPI0025C13312|nr:hypothetical protein [Hyphomicrobium sp.]MCC7253079.1 hypothetical protein [Hyphomicrobium sp.]